MLGNKNKGPNKQGPNMTPQQRPPFQGPGGQQSPGRPGMPPQGQPRPGMPPQGPGQPPRQGIPPQGPQGMPPQGPGPNQQGEKRGGLFGGRNKKNNQAPKQRPQPQQDGKKGGFLGGLFGGKKKQPQQPMPQGPPQQGMGPNPGMPPQRPQPQQGMGPGPQGIPPQGQKPMEQPPSNMGFPPQGPPTDSFGGPQPPFMGNQSATIPGQMPNEHTMGELNHPGSMDQPTMNRGMEMEHQRQHSAPTPRTRPMEYDVEREYFSREEAMREYGQKSMEQMVFLYAPKTKFLSIKKYIDDNYKGVIIMGSSNLATVIDDFRAKLNSSNVLIFVSSDEELETLIPFMEYLLEIKSKNPEMLSINVVLAKNVKIGVIKNVKRSNMMNILQTNSSMAQLSENTINEVMTMVISRQPTYIKAKIQRDRPQVASKKPAMSVNNLFRLQDMDELRRAVNLDKEENTGENLYASLSDTIMNAQSMEDVEKVVDLVPEFAVLDEYSRNLEEYLEENKHNLKPEELNEIFMSKLEVSAVQKEALETIFGNLIEYAKTQSQIEDEVVIESNRGLVMEMGNADDEELENLIEKRTELKTRVAKNFETYKKHVQVISNAAEIRKMLYQNIQTNLLPILDDGDYSDSVDRDISNITQDLLVQLNEDKTALDELKKDTTNRMIQTLEYTNSMLRDYQVIVSLDDVIIDKLMDDRQRAETMSINRVYNVDNDLKARGKAIRLIDQEDFSKMAKIVYKETFLVITNMEDIKFNNDLVRKTSEQFINEDYTENKVNVVSIQDWDDQDKLETRMNLLINKLKYISKYFQRVVFIFDDHINRYIRDRIMRELSEVIVFTNTDKNNLIETNKFMKYAETFDNILGRTVVINNYDKDTSEVTIGEIRTLAEIKKGVKEIHVNTHKAFKNRNDLAKTVLQLRSL